jgi:uncharacterized protein (TIGR03086 family)
MDAKTLFDKSLSQATDRMRHLTTGDFERTTPDTEWNAKTLANHMLYELSWIPDILAGKQIAEVGDKYDGDLVGDDPTKNWEEAAALAKGEVRLADMKGKAHLSYGTVKIEDYLRQVSEDLLIHSWDLAAALGIDRTLDQVAVKEIYGDLKPNASFLASSGLFKPPLGVPKDADIQTKMLALVGRDAGWEPGNRIPD